MRHFKFIGDPDDYAWDLKPEAGKIYDEAETFKNCSSLGILIDTARAHKFGHRQSKFLADWEEAPEGAKELRYFKFIGDWENKAYGLRPDPRKKYREDFKFNPEADSLGESLDIHRKQNPDKLPKDADALVGWREVFGPEAEEAKAPAPGPLDGVYYRYKGKARPDFIPGALYPGFITSHATPDTFDKWHLIGYHIGRWPNNWERVSITGGAVTIQPC
jgi:hypothetical protein